jgi:predicted O-methyltransferase YrrM
MSQYEFSNAWFAKYAKSIWEQYLPEIRPSRTLEIGSYEGQSTCFLIDALASVQPVEIHCCDTWEGSIEHQEAQTDMSMVERRFQSNLALAMKKAQYPVDLHVHRGYSDDSLAKLIASGKRNYFDFIYVDGSHQAPDVLSDAVLAFKLLKIGGIMGFDDYIWCAESLPYGKDPLRCPKPGIDAFVNLNMRKLDLMLVGLQLYLKKTAD